MIIFIQKIWPIRLVLEVAYFCADCYGNKLEVNDQCFSWQPLLAEGYKLGHVKLAV